MDNVCSNRGVFDSAPLRRRRRRLRCDAAITPTRRCNDQNYTIKGVKQNISSKQEQRNRKNTNSKRNCRPGATDTNVYTLRMDVQPLHTLAAFGPVQLNAMIVQGFVLMHNRSRSALICVMYSDRLPSLTKAARNKRNRRHTQTLSYLTAITSHMRTWLN